MDSYENFMGLPDSDKKKFFELIQKITGISSRSHDASETSNKDQSPLPSVINGTRSLISLSAVSQLPNHEKKSPMKQKTLDKWIIKTKVSSLEENAKETSETQQPDYKNLPRNDYSSGIPCFRSESVDCANAAAENSTITCEQAQVLERQEKSGTENECVQEQNTKQLNSGRKLVVLVERANIKDYLHDIKSPKNVDSMSKVSQISSSLQPTLPMNEERNLTTILREGKTASVLDVQKSISGSLSSVNSRLYNLRSVRHALDPTKSLESPANEVSNPFDERKADLKELSNTVSKETNKINAPSIISVTKQNQHSKKLFSKNCNENVNLSSAPVNPKKVDAHVKDVVNESALAKENWKIIIESVATNTISVTNTGCPIASEQINESVSHVGENLEDVIEKFLSNNCNEHANLPSVPVNQKKVDAQVKDGVNESVSLARDNWEMVTGSVATNTISVMNTGCPFASEQINESVSCVGKNLEEVIESVTTDTKSMKEIDTVVHTALKQDSEELDQLDKKTKRISASEVLVANPRKKLKKKSIPKVGIPKTLNKGQSFLSKTAGNRSVEKDFGICKDSLHTIEHLSEPGKKLKCKPKQTIIKLIPNDATKESTQTNSILTSKNVIPECVPKRKHRKKNLQSKELSSEISPLIKIIESKSNSPILEHESNVKAMNELPEKCVPLMVESSALNKDSLKRKKGGHHKNKNLGVSPSSTDLPQSAPLVFSPDNSEKEEILLSAQNSEADSKCIVSPCNKDVSDICPSRSHQCKRKTRSSSGSNRLSVELQNNYHSSSFNSSHHKKKISVHSGSDELSIEKQNPSSPIYQESSNAASIVLSSQNLKSHSNEKSQVSLSSPSSTRLHQRKRITRSSSGSNRLSVELQNDCHSSSFNRSPLPKKKISDHSGSDELSIEKQNPAPSIYQESSSAASIISSSQNFKPHRNDSVLSLSNENSQVPFLSSPCINKKQDTLKPDSPNFELQNSVQTNFTKCTSEEVNFSLQVTGYTLEVISNSDDNQNLSSSTCSSKKHTSKSKNLNELENLEIIVTDDTSSEKTVSSPQDDAELNYNKNIANKDEIVLPIPNDKIISNQIRPSNLDSSTPPSGSKKHRNKIRRNFKSKMLNKKLENIVVTIYTDSNSSKENTVSSTHNSLASGDDCYISNSSSPSLYKKGRQDSLTSSKEETISSAHTSLASDGDCHISDLSSPSLYKKERQDSLNSSKQKISSVHNSLLFGDDCHISDLSSSNLSKKERQDGLNTKSPNIESQISTSICAENSTSVEAVSSTLNSNSNPLIVQTNNDYQNPPSSINTYKNENQHFSKFQQLNDFKNLVVTIHTENNFSSGETVSSAQNSESFSRQIVMKSDYIDDRISFLSNTTLKQEIANSQKITDTMLETDVTEPLNKNYGLTPRTRLRKRKSSKVCEHAEFSSEKCSPSSTVQNNISENDAVTSVELNLLNIDANAEPMNLNANADSENLDMLNDIEMQLDSYINTEKNISFMEEQFLAISEVQSVASDAINSVTVDDCDIEASDLLLPSAKKMQFNYEAYCELSKLCNAIGVNLDELFQNPEVVNGIKTGSCEEIFIIRGHKLMMGNIVASICKTDKEFRDILREMQISSTNET